MSGEHRTPSDADAPEGVWAAVSPIFGARPDWRAAANRRRWPTAMALLFGIGLGGSVSLLAVSRLGASTGFVNTLESDLLELPAVEQFTLVVLLAPVVEELVFRLPLTERPRWGWLAAAGAVGALNFTFGGGPVVAVAALCALAVVGSMILWVQSLLSRLLRREGADAPVWRERVARWWAAHPRWPVWCSLAAFGLVHLSNYDVTWTAVTAAAAPLVVSPQLWLGLMFTIARVRYGWWAGLGLHAFHNLAVWSALSSALG